MQALVHMLGVRIHVLNRAELLARISQAAASGAGGIINNVNVHALNLAWRDRAYRDLLNASDLVFVDGMGIKLGAWLLGVEAGERLTYADWMDALFERCAVEGWPVFLLGDDDAIGQRFAQVLAQRHPNCPFAGHHSGYFDHFGPASEAVLTRINASGARILLVGLGMPLQEKWVWANRQHLRPPVRLTCGSFPRVYIGEIRRGPRWMTDHGLEWLYRLALQPRQMWRRYIYGNPLFVLRILRQRLFRQSPREQ